MKATVFIMNKCLQCNAAQHKWAPAGKYLTQDRWVCADIQYREKYTFQVILVVNLDAQWVYSQECFTQNNKSKRHGLTMQRESSPLQRKSDFQPSYQRRCCQATQTSTLKIRVNWLCWQHLSTPSLHQLSPTRSDPFKTSRATRRAWWEPVKAAQHVCFCRNYISFNIFRAFKSSSCTICSLCTVT